MRPLVLNGDYGAEIYKTALAAPFSVTGHLKVQPSRLGEHCFLELAPLPVGPLTTNHPPPASPGCPGIDAERRHFQPVPGTSAGQADRAGTAATAHCPQ